MSAQFVFPSHKLYRKIQNNYYLQINIYPNIKSWLNYVLIDIDFEDQINLLDETTWIKKNQIIYLDLITFLRYLFDQISTKYLILDQNQKYIDQIDVHKALYILQYISQNILTIIIYVIKSFKIFLPEITDIYPIGHEKLRNELSHPKTVLLERIVPKMDVVETEIVFVDIELKAVS